MWKLEPNEDYQRRAKKLEKKRLREHVAVHDNLDTYFTCLLSGTIPAKIIFGFIHKEPMGVKALDQKGGGPNLQQTRLYIYPDVSTETLHVLTLGDKQSQPADIKMCEDFVRKLREQQDEPNPD